MKIMSMYNKYFKNKILLITGGTGSFGKAVLKNVINSEIKEIRIFSRDESKQDQLRNKYKSDKLKFYIGDVRDKKSIDNAMNQVDFVFHAAALKQVPTCEFFPIEAVKTNIFGADNVLDSCIEYNVKKVVVLSTDKAVYPINAMGMSKALMEKVMIAKSRKNNNTIICATRYGNVIASRGSVIPLFVNQIKTNEALTITNPKMTRYMMTLQEAVDLVMYAFQKGNRGDIFVQKSPAATIKLIALVLKDIFNSDVPIKYIGTRHGEKLFETLVNREEMAKVIESQNFFQIPYDDRDLNYEKFYNSESDFLDEYEDYNSHNTEQLDFSSLKELLYSTDFIQDMLI